MARKRKSLKRRGALSVLAVLLVLSAILRVGDYAGQAVARELEVPESMPVPIEDRPIDIQPLLDAIAQREARVEKREEQIELRMIVLEEAEIELSLRLDELRSADARLRETLALADEAAENDLARLTSVYENMKPKQAAALFEAMDPDFAAGFMGRMKPAAAAGIMAGLSPDAAYAISAVLAGRNADVPTE